MPTVQSNPVETLSVHTCETRVRYRVSKHATIKERRGTLVDRGANGGIIGNDAHVIYQYQKTVDVTGIDNHEMPGLKIVDASATTISHRGPIVIIMKQYAYHGRHRSIHSSGQIEKYKNPVDDRSWKVGGDQTIRTHDGYVLPIDIINGLPYLRMRPNTQHEWDTLPHVALTSGEEWDPKVLDNVISNLEDWYSHVAREDDGLILSPFDEFGNYKEREQVVPLRRSTRLVTKQKGEPDMVVETHEEDDRVEDHQDTTLVLIGNVKDLRECFKAALDLNARYVCPDPSAEPNEEMDQELWELEINDFKETKKKKVNYESLRPYFLHVPAEKVRQTFKNTTQHAANVVSGHNLFQTTKSPNPALNVPRRNEPVATDSVFADVPAIDSPGYMAAQFYVGRKSLVCDIYGMTSEKQFVNTLEDIIHKRGAMDLLITDGAKAEQLE